MIHIREEIGTVMINWKEEFKKMEKHIDELWTKYVKIKRKNGSVSYDCRLGLFGVYGPDTKELEQEAKNYFRQYFEDGEYS